MIPELAYAFVLSVVTLLATAKGDAAMRRTVAVIFAAWVLDIAFTRLTGIYAPWLWFVVIDTIAVRILMFPPRGKLQGFVGVAFCAQLAVNIGYGAYTVQYGYDFERAILRWEVIEVIGYVKLFLVGGWALADVVRGYLARRRATAQVAGVARLGRVD